MSEQILDALRVAIESGHNCGVCPHCLAVLVVENEAGRHACPRCGGAITLEDGEDGRLVISADATADRLLTILRELLRSVRRDDPSEWDRVGMADILVLGEHVAAGLRILAAHPAPAWQPGPPRAPGWYWVHLAPKRGVLCLYVRRGNNANAYEHMSDLLFRPDTYQMTDCTHHIGPLAAPAPPGEGE